jgi:hypothetical protein
MHLLAVAHGAFDMMIGPVSVTMRHSIHSGGSLKNHLFRHRLGVENLHATVVLPQHDALDTLLIRNDNTSGKYYGSLWAKPIGPGPRRALRNFAKKVRNLVHLRDALTPIEEYAATVA